MVAHRSFRFGLPTAAEPEVSVNDLEAAPDADEAAETAEMAESARAAEAPPRPWPAGRTPWGGQRPRPPLRTRLKWTALRYLGGGSIVPDVTHPVEHGDVLELANREWFVVHTPGHTSDHFCLHDPDTGLFLAGDHVLPTITPHISGISSSPDPQFEVAYFPMG